jgi:hypothetical protein
MQQVYEQCRATLNEYLWPAAPPEVLIESPSNSIERYPRSQSTTRLRCPKGDRACDAQHLGWFMKRLAELDILPAVLPSAASPRAVPADRSLHEVMNALCTMPSPPQPHQHDNEHSGGSSSICDFVPTFRAAIRDIHASVQGLTLAEVSITGKRFWALSKRRNREPERDRERDADPDDVMINNASPEEGHEPLFEIAARERCAPGDNSNMRDDGDGHSDDDAATAFFRSSCGSADTTHATNATSEINNGDGDDTVYFRILSLLSDPRDLRAAAQVNRSFYRSYKRHEAELLLNGVRRPSDHIGNIPDTAAVSPREKFRYGEVLLVDGNRSSDGGIDTDGNKFLASGQDDKFAADVREQFLVGTPSQRRRRTAEVEARGGEAQRRSFPLPAPTQGRERDRDGDGWLMNGWI